MLARFAVLAVLLLAGTVARADDPKGPAEAKVTYEQVKPILAKRCNKCHAGERPRGELETSTFGGIMQGGVSGKSVVAGKPAESLLYTLTAHLEDPKMPPNSPKIPQTEIDTLRKWIEHGLIEKAGGATATVTQTPAVKVPDGLTTAVPLARATPVTALAASPVAPLVAVAGNKQVLVFASGKLLGGVPFPEGEVHVLRFSRDGAVLLAAGGVGGQSGAVVGFSVGDWKRTFAVADTTDAVIAADISPDKSRVVFGGPSRVVKVATVTDAKVVHTFRKPTDWVLSTAFSPDGLLVAAGDRFGGLYLWESKSGKEFAALRGHTKGVTGLAFRTDGDALASASDDGTVRVWNLHTGAEAAKWTAHAEGTLDVHWHSGALATAGRDGHVRTWDEKGKKLADLGPAADAVLKVALSADAKTAFAGDWSGAVRVWPVSGGAASALALPVSAKPAAVAAIPVPVPELPVAAVKPAAPTVGTAIEVLKADLARKRATLKAIEDAAERLKDEAARDPKNAALAKAYLQLCEAALVLKAEVLAAEAKAAQK
jgi:WD40 repeat protein